MFKYFYILAPAPYINFELISDHSPSGNETILNFYIF